MPAATRTQVYFSARQRRRLDALAAQRRVPLALVIRDAVDAYLDGLGEDPDTALIETFGTIPDMKMPDRKQWRGRGRHPR